MKSDLVPITTLRPGDMYSWSHVDRGTALVIGTELRDGSWYLTSLKLARIQSLKFYVVGDFENHSGATLVTKITL